jgi:hypothetical protein
MTSQDDDLEKYCRDLYVRASREWDLVRYQFVTGTLAFGILYAPPRLKPPLLILGTNPGYEEDDDSKTWPNENLFAIYSPPPTAQPAFLEAGAGAEKVFRPYWQRDCTCGERSHELTVLQKQRNERRGRFRLEKQSASGARQN